MNWVFFFSALGILLWFFALLYLKSYVRQRTDPGHILGSLREEVRLLEAVIDEKTEHDLELLEERMRSLRELVAEAEKRIAVYAREMDRRGAQDTAFSALRAEKASALHAEKAADRPAAGRKKNRRKGSLLDSLEIRALNAAQAAGAYSAQVSTGGETKPAGPPLPPQGPRFVRSGNPVIPPPPPLRERVAELYRAGFSENLIALRLGISVTEARLYIAMHKPRPPGV
jgi:hypothetical protein